MYNQDVAESDWNEDAESYISEIDSWLFQTLLRKVEAMPKSQYSVMCCGLLPRRLLPQLFNPPSCNFVLIAKSAAQEVNKSKSEKLRPAL